MTKQCISSERRAFGKNPKVPCYECARSGVSDPCEFNADELLSLIADYKLSTECGIRNKVVQLNNLVPDLLMADLDAAFLLDASELNCKK